MNFNFFAEFKLIFKSRRLITNFSKKNSACYKHSYKNIKKSLLFIINDKKKQTNLLPLSAK